MNLTDEQSKQIADMLDTLQKRPENLVPVITTLLMFSSKKNHHILRSLSDIVVTIAATMSSQKKDDCELSNQQVAMEMLDAIYLSARQDVADYPEYLDLFVKSLVKKQQP